MMIAESTSSQHLRVPGFRDGVLLESGPRTTVIRAVRIADDRPVVLKVLTRPAPTPEDFGRFRSAARYGRALAAPGVVVTLDLIEHEGRPVLVMEDVGGVALAQLLGRDGMEIGAAVRIGLALANALAGLHAANLMHRDLNPSNAILNPETGLVQIIDLDLVSPITREAGAMPMGGTLAWLAPEQTGRTGRPVDSRADLYALGTTLYALFTGGPPFHDDDPMGLIYGHLAVPPRPPHLSRVDLPRVLSDIVLKLLAKAPEDRYQSARGVAADLTRCLAAIEAGQAPAPFPLGESDRPSALVLARRLVGREAETQRLLEGFELAATGRARLFLVAGTSGVGKTSLVAEVQTPITRQRGRFVEGKYNQYQNAPASALLAALGQLIHEALSEPEARLTALRASLSQALGANGQVIEEVLPELALLLGPQPPAPPLPPAEAQNRFNRTFQRFVLGFAQEEQPLVLFLDDLQWADPSSLQLIRQLFLDPDASHLLLIGAYRDNEVGPGHPLVRALDDLREGGAPVDTVTLSPLPAEAVASIVADSLREPVSRVEPLSAFVSRRTHGNPFFVEHLLRLLVEQGALRLDGATGAWSWNLELGATLGVSNDVGALLAHRVERLPAPTVEALRRAAVLGASFDLGTLSVVAGEPAAALMERLWPAVEEGLLVPVGEGWRFVGSVADEAARFRFAHDRVQEAAYLRVPEAERQDMHLTAGRLLNAGPRRDELLLDIVAHMNRGRGRILDRDERIALARLNQEAGRRARRGGAFDAAWGLFATATELLPEHAAELLRPLAYWLHHDRAEAASLCGRYDDARQSASLAFALASSAEERTNITVIRLGVHSVLGEFAPSVATAIEALRDFGLTPPSDAAGWQALAMGLMGQIGARVAETGVAALADAPLLTDQDALQELRVLAACAGAAMPDPPFFAWVTARSVWLSVTYGASVYSPAGYVYYGFLLVAFGQPAVGDAFGQAALRLVERLDAPNARPAVHHIYGAYVAPRSHPLRLCLEHCLTAYQQGLEHGVFPNAGWALANLPWLELWSGEELGSIAENAQDYVKVAQRLLKNADTTNMIANTAHAVARLTGRTEGAEILTSQGLGEERVLENLAHYEMALAPGWTVRLQAAVVLGDREGMARALEVGPRLNAIDLLFSALEFPFWQALALLDLDRLGDEEGLQTWARCRERVEAAAQGAPTSFRCKALLLGALERAREGDLNGAGEGLDLAIAAASEDGQIAVEAQALERAAALWAHRPRLARLYRQDAALAYTRWGALARVAALERAWPELRAQPEAHGTRTHDDLSLLDMETVSRASQALTSEMHLDRLLTTLMRIVVENAGAGRGCLLRGPEGALEVAAWAEDGQIGTYPGARPAYSPEIVAYVARTGETVLLPDATADARYRRTAYVASARPRSVLAVPLIHQGKTTGILYLENNLAADAFSSQRVSLLRLLSGLAATALENATLYEAQQRAAAELARKNEQLTELDRMREEFLARTSHELRTPLHGIIGLAQSMLEGASGPVSPDQRHDLSMIVASGRRLSNLVNDILDLSTLNHRRIVLATRPVAVGPILESVLAVCRPLVGERPVTLRAEISPDLPLAQADRDRVEQILHNLVGNAIKFTDRGEVVARAERAGDRVLISVTDTGVGISAEAQRAIFEPFNQGDADQARGGTGLGLAVSSQLVALHGGELTVRSEPGRGSTFTFTLPVGQGDSLPEPTSTRPVPLALEPAPAQPLEVAGPTILVVDDEPVNLRVLLLQLNQRGYRVFTAVSGPEALRRIDEGLRPDLVLLDVMMPTMSGYEVCSILRQRFPATALPVVMLTAKSQPTDVVEGMGSGANDYVVKPFSSDELLARVRTHMQLSHLHQSAERFVPQAFLDLLERPSVVEVQKGDCVARDMTVLNADLRGFTRILEQRPPLETFGFLNRYLSVVEPHIVANHGFVDRYVGASLTALFPGGPEHGVAAAVEMLSAVARFNDERAAEGQAPVVPGIGLNAGHLLLGTVGGTHHLDTTVVSEAVGVAERAAGLTTRYNAGIVVTGSVIGFAPESVRAASRMLDRVTLEGRAEPITVYEIYLADPPAVRAAKDASRTSFEAAVRLFHERSFTEAQRLFLLCQALNPMDQAVAQYLERCLRIQRSLLMMEP